MNGSLSMFYITDEMTYTASRMPDGLYGIITGHAGTGKTSRNGTDTHEGIATIICMPIRMPPSTSTTTHYPGPEAWAGCSQSAVWSATGRPETESVGKTLTPKPQDCHEGR